MKKLIATALLAVSVVAAPNAVADTGKTTGGSGRGVENKTTPPAPKPNVPADFGQKLADAVRNAIH